MTPPPLPRPSTIEERVATLEHRIGELAIKTARAASDLSRRESEQRRNTPHPGSYSSAGLRSIFPPAGKPTDTGSWNIKNEYLEQIQKQIEALHQAREDAELKAALATAKAEGEKEARQQQAADAAKAKEAAAEADAIVEKISGRRIRNLKLVLAIVAVLFPALAWCGNEARHAAASVAVPSTTAH